jgi:hypothetical protein
LFEVLLPQKLALFPNIQTLELGKGFTSNSVLSIVKECRLLVALEFTSLTLSDKSLSIMMQQLPLLTVFVMYDSTGFDGLSWLKHPRLERADIGINSFAEEGAGQQALSGSENALKLLGSDLPRLRELTTYTRRTNLKDERPRLVSGFSALTVIDVRSCKDLVIQDTPLLKTLNVGFSASDCTFVVRNAPLAKELDVTLESEVKNFDVSSSEFPGVDLCTCAYTPSLLKPHEMLRDFVKASPNLHQLTIGGGSVPIDSNYLWSFSSRPFKVVHMDDEWQ